MLAATRLLHTWHHWLMVGSLLLAAGLGLDAAWIHARVALAQWLDGLRWPLAAREPGARGANLNDTVDNSACAPGTNRQRPGRTY